MALCCLIKSYPSSLNCKQGIMKWPWWAMESMMHLLWLAATVGIAMGAVGSDVAIETPTLL
jgi:hypothetical protein